ncbi:MAG: hypothetical protein JWN34_2346 [Bryobacterales bacterium]|nr:hypothetical protein [Bryobacterales bacterium]
MLGIRHGPQCRLGQASWCRLGTYERRITGTMRCTFWLNVAIICFVTTVFLTGLSVLLPGNTTVMTLTTGVMAAGLAIVVGAIAGELWSNRLAAPTLYTELTTGTPEYEPVKAHAGNRN